MSRKRIVSLLCLPLLPIFLEGCVTRALWRADNVHEPASSPNLKLYRYPHTNQNDVLVQYDEVSEASEKTHRRAYFLFENADRIARRQKPRFVSPDRSAGMTEIPLAPENPTSPPPADPDLRAQTDLEHQTFALYSGGAEIGQFGLPVYPGPIRRTGQILLTPATVVTDVALCGTLIGFVFWAESGFFPITEQSRGSP